jgi:hypothetical protein
LTWFYALDYAGKIIGIVTPHQIFKQKIKKKFKTQQILTFKNKMFYICMGIKYNFEVTYHLGTLLLEPIPKIFKNYGQ